MSPALSSVVQLIGRALLAAIFILGGWGKISNPAGTIAYIAHGGLPLPQIAYGVSVLIEFGGGLAILFGLATRPVALVMAVFCIVTAAVFHYPFTDQGMMINFMKNLGMAGGFLQLVALGAGSLSLDTMFLRKKS